jgi:hypothetical protein
MLPGPSKPLYLTVGMNRNLILLDLFLAGELLAHVQG